MSDRQACYLSRHLFLVVRPPQVTGNEPRIVYVARLLHRYTRSSLATSWHSVDCYNIYWNVFGSMTKTQMTKTAVKDIVHINGFVFQYKCRSGMLKWAICDFISRKRCNTETRRTRTVIGARDFAVSCAVIWNSLPIDLRVSSLSAATFARHLKACLFRRPSLRIWGLHILRYVNHITISISCTVSEI